MSTQGDQKSSYRLKWRRQCCILKDICQRDNLISLDLAWLMSLISCFFRLNVQKKGSITQKLSRLGSNCMQHFTVCSFQICIIFSSFVSCPMNIFTADKAGWCDNGSSVFTVDVELILKAMMVQGQGSAGSLRVCFCGKLFPLCSCLCFIRVKGKRCLSDSFCSAAELVEF